MTSLIEPEPPALPATAPSATGPAGTGFRLAGLRPWHGRARLRDVLCVAAIAASALYSVAMIPMAPLLISTHPVMLEAVAGSNASVVAAGAFSAVRTHLPLAIVIAAALPSMMRSDWVMWWAGRLWGQRFVEMLSKQNRRGAAQARLLRRRGKRFAVALVAMAAFLPGGTQAPLYATAGALGLPLPVFVAADAVGTTAWVALLAVLGHRLGSAGVAMAGLVSRYTLAAICLPAAAMIAPHVWRAWRHRGRGTGAARKAAAAAAPGSRPGG